MRQGQDTEKGTRDKGQGKTEGDLLAGSSDPGPRNPDPDRILYCDQTSTRSPVVFS